jgi:hypothetical protein
VLQVVRLHDLDPSGAPAESLLAALPDQLFVDKKGAEADTVRAALVPLLAAALEAGLTGIGASAVSLLADLLRDGLPERHLLVLVESAVAEAHPLVVALERRGGIADAGRLNRSGRDRGSAACARSHRETGRHHSRRRVEPHAARSARRTAGAANPERWPPTDGAPAAVPQAGRARGGRRSTRKLKRT